MALPTIRKPTVAPSRKMARDVYPIVADEWAASIGPFTEDLITAITWMGNQVTDVAGFRDQAAASVKAAAQSVTDAVAQVKLATDQAVASKGSADAAARQLASTETVAAAVRAQINLPSLAGQKGKFWQVADDEKTLQLVPLIVNRVGDVLTTASVPDSTFVADDSRYLQSLLPDLFAKVGLVGYNDIDNVTKINAATNLSAGSTITGGFIYPKDGQPLSLSNSTIQKLTDTGSTKIADSPAQYAFTCAATDDKGVIVAISAYDGWMRSTDNGATFTKLTIPNNMTGFYNWTSIASDGKTYWLATNYNGSTLTLARSVDNGLTWSILPTSGLSNPGYTPYLSCRNEIFYLNWSGGDPNIYRSSTRGSSWTALPTTPSPSGVAYNLSYSSVAMSRVATSANLIVVVRTDGFSSGGSTYYNSFLCYSTDSGATWQYIQYSPVSGGYSSAQWIGGYVVISNDGTVVVAEMNQQNRIFVAKNIGMVKRTITGQMIACTMNGPNIALATDLLGTWFIGSGASFKKITPIYDAKLYFYVPKLPEVPAPFVNYVKAKLQ